MISAYTALTKYAENEAPMARPSDKKQAIMDPAISTSCSGTSLFKQKAII